MFSTIFWNDKLIKMCTTNLHSTHFMLSTFFCTIETLWYKSFWRSNKLQCYITLSSCRLQNMYWLFVILKQFEIIVSIKLLFTLKFHWCFIWIIKTVSMLPDVYLIENNAFQMYQYTAHFTNAGQHMGR